MFYKFGAYIRVLERSVHVEEKQKTVLDITISHNRLNNKYGYVYHKTMDETLSF